MKKYFGIVVAVWVIVAAGVWAVRNARTAEPPNAGRETTTAPVPAPDIPSPARPEERIPQEKVDAAVEEFMRSKIAWQKLPARMKAMAQAGEFTVRVLMALTNKRGRIQTYAAEGLGWVKHPAMLPQVAALLEKKFGDRNVDTACAALKSYAKIKKDEGVPTLTAYIATDYHRPDGHGERVCTAAVEGLGEMGTKRSHDALLGQLARVDEPTWLMDYGSTVVKALVRHDEVSAVSAGGATRPVRSGSFERIMGRRAPMATPEKKGLRSPYRDQTSDALVRYAERLRARLPKVLSPNGKKYVEGKIAEALSAAGI